MFSECPPPSPSVYIISQTAILTIMNNQIWPLDWRTNRRVGGGDMEEGNYSRDCDGPEGRLSDRYQPLVKGATSD